MTITTLLLTAGDAPRAAASSTPGAGAASVPWTRCIGCDGFHPAEVQLQTDVEVGSEHVLVTRRKV